MSVKHTNINFQSFSGVYILIHFLRTKTVYFRIFFLKFWKLMFVCSFQLRARMRLQLKRLPQPQDRLIMTRRIFLTALDHSGLGIMNVIPYAIHPGATLTMEIVKVCKKRCSGFGNSLFIIIQRISNCGILTKTK